MGDHPHPPHNQLSADYIRKVARLSRLEVSDADIPDLQTRLSAVVTYVDRLRALDLTGVEPLANVADTVNRLDADIPGPVLPNDVLMRMAPQTMPPFIKVPKVIDDGGSA